MESTPSYPRRGSKRKRFENEIQEATPVMSKVVPSTGAGDFKPIECLSENTISEGMLLLGCITNVTETALKISLPGCLTGIVPIDQISAPYNSLRNLSVNAATAQPVPPLHYMFHVAETYPCKVISVVKEPVSTKTSILLSINPVDVNSNLGISMIYDNMIISAAVKFDEDHGYSMDIGIPGLPGFMRYADIESGSSPGHELHMGQVIPVRIKSFNTNANIVHLVPYAKSQPFPKIKENMKLSLSAFVPGAVVHAIVRRCNKQGLILRCMGYDACIWRDHVPPNVDPANICYTGVTATFLYVHPLTRLLYLSLNPKPSLSHIDFLKSQSLWEKWTVIESAVVSKVEKRCVYFNLGFNIRGQAFKKELSDVPVANLTELYAPDTIHRCRILSVHPMDNIIKITLKQSALNMKIIRPDEIIVGALFMGKVHKFVRNGMVAKLSPNMYGFVRDIQMIDSPSENPCNSFSIGEQIQCRVLSADFTISPYSLYLTCKKSLCDVDLPILTSYATAYTGLITKGVVVSIATNSIVLLFFNEVQGIVMKSPNETIASSYYIGQVVKCRVTYCKPDQKVLHLSLKHVTSTEEIESFSPTPALYVGNVVPAYLTVKKKRGFEVQLGNLSVRGYLPYDHLTDYVDNAREMELLYTVNDVINVLIFTTSNNNIIVTAKYSFLQAVQENKLRQDPSDFQIGDVISGVVKDFVSSGMMLQLGNNISGFVPKRLMKDYAAPECSFTTDQTLLAKVIKIDDDFQIKLSTKISDVFDKNPQYSLDALESYLADRDKMKMLRARFHDYQKKMSYFNVGEIISVEIVKVTGSRTNCKCKNGTVAVAWGSNRGSGLEIGKSYKAVVLFLDFQMKRINISLAYHHVKCTLRRKEKNCFEVKIGQVVKAEAIFICKEYTLVHLEGHAVGSFAYIPARKVINDDIGRSRLFTMGLFYRISIERTVNGKFLAILEKHKHNYEKSVLQTSQTFSPFDIPDNEDSNQSSNSEIFIDSSQESEESRTHISIEDTDANPCYSSPPRDELSIRLAVGEVCEATVQSVENLQINIMMNKNLKGRVHATNIGTTESGIFPLKSYAKGDTLNVKILGYHKKQSFNYLILSHRHFMNYAECALAENPNSAPSIDLTAGKSIIGFIEEITDASMSVSLSPEHAAHLPFLNILQTPKDLRTLKKAYNVGETIRSTILSIPNECNITLTQLDQNWTPIQGKNIAAYVHISSLDRGLVVKLAHDYTGEIAITDVSDNFDNTEFVVSKFKKQQYIICSVVDVDTDSKCCTLSTRTSRLYKKKKSIVDKEVTASSIAKGQSFRGFVKLITTSVIHVNVGRKVEGVVDINMLSAQKKEQLKKEYRIGDVIKVKVLSVVPEIKLYMDEVKPPLTSARQEAEPGSRKK